MKPGEREIRAWLRSGEAPAPPDDLAERIKSEIPEYLEAAPIDDDVRFRRPSPLRRYLWAAAVVMAFGGSFLAYRVQREVTLDGSIGRVSAARDPEVAAPPASSPSPAPSPPPAAPVAVDEVIATRIVPAPLPEALGEPTEETDAVPSEIAATRREQEPRREASLEAIRRQETKAIAEPTSRDDRARGERRSYVLRPSAPEAALETEADVEKESIEESRVGRLKAARARSGPPSLALAEDEALSAFAFDVDTASYTEVRDFLRAGRLPPPEAVRMEELVDAFDYGDSPPRAGDLAIRAEGTPVPFGERGRHLLRVHLRARDPGAGAARAVVTRARVQVTFDPEIVATYRRVGARDSEVAVESVAVESVRDDLVNLGEIGAGDASTILYEIRLRRRPRRGDEVATLHLRHDPVLGAERTETVHRVTGEDIARRWDGASAALRLTSLVAELAEVLGPRARSSDLDEIARRAREVAAELPDAAEVAELAELAVRAKVDRR